MIPRPWWPAAVWAALILVITSWPNPRVPAAPAGTDKAVHALMYLVLGVLTARALRLTAAVRPRAVMATLAAIATFALVDELHQAWIPGRSADHADWLADIAGGTTGLLLSLATAPRRRESLP